MPGFCAMHFSWTTSFNLHNYDYPHFTNNAVDV